MIYFKCELEGDIGHGYVISVWQGERKLASVVELFFEDIKQTLHSETILYRGPRWIHANTKIDGAEASLVDLTRYKGPVRVVYESGRGETLENHEWEWTF